MPVFWKSDGPRWALREEITSHPSPGAIGLTGAWKEGTWKEVPCHGDLPSLQMMGICSGGDRVALPPAGSTLATGSPVPTRGIRTNVCTRQAWVFRLWHLTHPRLIRWKTITFSSCLESCRQSLLKRLSFLSSNLARLINVWDHF